MPNDSNYEYYVVDSHQSLYATMLRNTSTTSYPMTYYTGYYAGGTPTVLAPHPMDVAQDLSTGNLWQYTGAAWVAPSWNSAITFYLGGATTVCERLKSADTKLPDTITLYPGDDSPVPADLMLSGNDLAIKHDIGNYSVQVNVFRQDVTTDTVVDVPFPEGYIISTDDGDWTILKNFNEYAGFDYCTIALTWTNTAGGIGPQTLNFVTSGEVDLMISSAIESSGSGGGIDSGAVMEIVSNYAAPKAVEIVDSTSTSAYIPVLSGGYYYTFTQPVSALRIDSVVNAPEPAVVNIKPTAVVNGISLYYPIEVTWDEGWTTPIDTSYKAIPLSASAGGYVFTPGDDYEWYNSLGGEGQYSGWFSGGSFTCVSANGAWVISAQGVTEYIWHEGDIEEERLLNGLVASSVDNMTTWQLSDAVVIYAYTWTEEMSRCDLEGPVHSVGISGTPFSLDLPASVTYINNNSAALTTNASNRLTFVQGAALVQEVVSSGAAYADPVIAKVTAAGFVNGSQVMSIALPKDAPFSTTVAYSDAGQDMRVNHMVVFNSSGVTIDAQGGDYFNTERSSAHVVVDPGGVSCSVQSSNDFEYSTVSVLIANNGAVYINDVDCVQRYVETDAAYVIGNDDTPPEGETAYYPPSDQNVYVKFTSPLSSVSIPAMSQGAAFTMEFTLAEGASGPSLSPLPLYGVNPETAGTPYLLTVTANCVVCAEKNNA